MWGTELAVRHRGCPVSDTCIDHPSITVGNLSKLRLGESHEKRLLRVHGPPEAVDAFAGDFREHDGTVSFDRISDTDPEAPTYFTSELAYQEENPSILSLIHQTECYQHSTVSVTQGIENWTIYSEQKPQVRDLVELIKEHGNNVDLCRSVDVATITDGKSMQLATLQTKLTEKQTAVYEAALELGYYDGDASVTISDLAGHLGLHRSTVGEHIKKVENRILTEIGTQMFTATEYSRE